MPGHGENIKFDEELEKEAAARKKGKSL